MIYMAVNPIRSTDSMALEVKKPFGDMAKWLNQHYGVVTLLLLYSFYRFDLGISSKEHNLWSLRISQFGSKSSMDDMLVQ
jgi:hypothetical protein